MKPDNVKVIAQDDDQDYSESGWVAYIVDGVAKLGSYSHCSCYGTWDDDAPESWSGTPDELVAMAVGKFDPDISNRVTDPEDRDYDHLMAVYAGVIDWDKAGRLL